MEDKIINSNEELSTMIITLKDGTKIPTKTKTIYTHWESGRKDCKIEILEPLNGSAKQQK